MIKALTICFIALALNANFPILGVNVDKSSFMLFIKYVNFTPFIKLSQRDQVQINTLSKWYIFAGYYDKLQRGELSMAVSYRLEKEEDYISERIKISDEGYGITSSEIDLSSKCILNNKTSATMSDITFDSDNKVFTLLITVICDKVDFGEVFDKISQAAGEVSKAMDAL